MSGALARIEVTAAPCTGQPERRRFRVKPAPPAPAKPVRESRELGEGIRVILRDGVPMWVYIGDDIYFSAAEAAFTDAFPAGYHLAVRPCWGPRRTVPSRRWT